MSVKRTHDVVATVGSYTTPEGKIKKRYQNCGTATTNDEGQISIKLNAVPVAPDWSGWMNLYPITNDNVAKMSQQSPASKQNFTDDDDIPF